MLFSHVVTRKLVGVIAALLVASVSHAEVTLGLENLLQNKLELIEGKRIGLLANHTAIDSEGTPILERLSEHCDVTAIFAMEHGFEGNLEAGKKIDDKAQDDFVIYSLYGKTRKPTEAMLEKVDVIIYDVQDVGAKFYTYISSLYNTMQAAEEFGKPVIVLDRPNPIRADKVEGPVTQTDFYSFVGIGPLPLRYGMTPGEVAKWFNSTEIEGETIGADLTVVEMLGYTRSLDYEDTGLPWVAPSPNMPDLETAYLYPGTCLFEGTNVTEGRGTPRPFLTIGAPFIDAKEWMNALPKDVLSGVKIKTVKFTPESIPGKVSRPKFEGETCYGLSLEIVDESTIQPVPMAVAMLCALRDLYPEDFETKSFMNLLWGSDSLRKSIEAGDSYKDIVTAYQNDLEKFMGTRTGSLIYKN